MLANRKITIIIPIHNGEKFINSTLNNLLEYKKISAEKNTDIEIIAILDGCDDGSETELMKFRNKLDFKLEKNLSKKGPSHCRNYGINNSCGDYVLFLDIDDSLVLHGLDELIENLNHESDIFIGDYYIKRGDKIDLRRHSMPSDINKNFITMEFIAEYLLKYTREPYIYTLFVHCWCKVYRSEFLKENRILFNEKIDQLEDTNFNFKCLRYLPKVFYLNKPIYCYTANSSSSNLSKLSGGNKKNIKNIIRALHIIKKIFQNMELKLAKDYRYHLYATLFILWLIRASRESKRFNEIYNVFIEYCRDKAVRCSMQYYVRLKSNDQILPFMVLFNMPSLALGYCKLIKSRI